MDTEPDMSGNSSINPVYTPPVVPPFNPAGLARPMQNLLAPVVPYVLDTVYHPIQSAFTPVPQGGSSGPSGVRGPYALPAGQSLGGAAGFRRALPFAVAMAPL